MPQAQKDMLYEQYKNKLLLKHIANADEVADAFLFCMKYVWVSKFMSTVSI